MTELHSDAHRAASERVQEDLRALGSASAHHVPGLERSVAAIRSRRLTAVQRWKERLMPITNTFVRRPWLATAGIIAVLAVVMLVVPIGYDRTVGHDVSLTLRGVKDPSRTRDIARELESVLGVEHVGAKVAMDGAGAAITLQAFVPAGSGIDPDARARAFARELERRGYVAAAVTTPKREHVSGSVYAYARNLVIQVSTDGKSSAQIESEIRQRLADAGISNTTVSVTDDGKQRKVMIEAQHEAGDGTTEPANVELQLTKNGQPLVAGNGVSVKIQKMRSPDGVALHLEVTANSKSATIDVPRSDSMTDAALAAEIRSRLLAAGIDVDVQVTGGQVQIQEKP